MPLFTPEKKAEYDAALVEKIKNDDLFVEELMGLVPEMIRTVRSEIIERYISSPYGGKSVGEIQFPKISTPWRNKIFYLYPEAKSRLKDLIEAEVIAAFDDVDVDVQVGSNPDIYIIHTSIRKE
jgi:hypothetical protein